MTVTDAQPATTPTAATAATHPRGPWLQIATPAGFEYNRHTLPIRDLPPALHGFRIIHLSDIHFKNDKPWLPVWDEVIQRVRAADADIVLITGDFVDAKFNHRPALPKVQRFIDALASRMGTFGILGNHDMHLFRRHARKRGMRITLLDHQRLQLPTPAGPSIELIGLNGVARKLLRRDYVRSLPPRTPGQPRITLCHYPDQILKAESLDSDLYLAGHTHGGQCCLPGGFPLMRHDKLPRKFAKGVHRWQNTWFVINKGIGFSGYEIRTFCPAEIIELTLTRG